MLDSFSTKATVAKIHAMHGKMLKETDYNELITKQSVNEVAEYLKKTPRYKELLAGIDTNTIHRGFLEVLIRRNNFDTYVKLCNFQHLDKEKFYQFDIKREEVQQILSCILHINAGQSENYIQSLPSYLIKHASFDLIDLAKCSTFEELLKVLKNTPYYNSLKDVEVNERGHVSVLKCEGILRTNFYKELFEIVNKSFRGKEKERLKDSIYTQLDLINFTNAFRMKTYFGATPDEIKDKMFDFYGKISKKQMFRFYEAPDKDKMLELFGKTLYARQIDKINSEIVENSIMLIRYKSAKRALQNAQTAPVAMYTFLFLCEVEMQNLISIIEGKRYNVEQSNIEKLLII